MADLVEVTNHTVGGAPIDTVRLRYEAISEVTDDGVAPGFNKLVMFSANEYVLSDAEWDAFQSSVGDSFGSVVI